MHSVLVFESHGGITGIHNALFDTVMPSISGNAWKLLCLVVRQTAGWNRREVGLSYRDLIKGMGVKSRSTVAAAIRELEPLNLLTTTHAEWWEETRFGLNYESAIGWTPVNFGVEPPVPEIVPVPKTVTEEAVTEIVPVTETGTELPVPETVPPVPEIVLAPVTEIVPPPVPETVLFNRKEIKNKNTEVVARVREDYDDDLPEISHPEISEPATTGNQQPKQTGASPARTPATIYEKISNRQLAIAETELIETSVPQVECDQFERFLRGWAATYGTKGVFKVLKAYDEQKPKQSPVTRSWTQADRDNYDAYLRECAKARKSNKSLAGQSKRVHSSMASGTPRGSVGGVAGGAEIRPRLGMAPCLPMGALLAEKERIQQILDSRRPAVCLEQAQSEPEMELPF